MEAVALHSQYTTGVSLPVDIEFIRQLHARITAESFTDTNYPRVVRVKESGIAGVWLANGNIG